MEVEEDAASFDTSQEEHRMPQPLPQPPTPKPAGKPPEPPAEATPPEPDDASQEGIIFRALLDAGAEAVVAYTADRRIHRVISETVGPQLRPFMGEIGRRFDEQDRKLDTVMEVLTAHGEKLDEHDRKLDTLTAVVTGHGERLAGHDRILAEHGRILDEHGRILAEHGRILAEHGRKLDEHDRKLDVILARLDGLKLLGQIMVGAYALLITVLIAVFGLLFTG